MSKHTSTRGKRERAFAQYWLSRSVALSNKERGSGRLFTVVLFSFIVFFLLVTLLVGMQVYSTVNDSRVASDNSRLSLSLIAHNVRMNDSTDSISVGNGPEGQALVLTENLEAGSYETRIYAYEGKIVEEYTASDNTYTPEKAQELARSDRFEFAYRDGLLTVYTDHGSVDIALRSAQGAW